MGLGHVGTKSSNDLGLDQKLPIVLRLCFVFGVIYQILEQESSERKRIMDFILDRSKHKMIGRYIACGECTISKKLIR